MTYPGAPVANAADGDVLIIHTKAPHNFYGMHMKRKLQVFVSSTYTDLIDERQAAVAAILKAGHIPAGMELFTAGNKSQLEVVKQWIKESDVYLLLLGARYGSIEPT